MLQQLLYTSAAAVPFEQPAVDDLLEAARRRNQQAGITGFLLFDGSHFLQLLEGDARPLAALFDSKIAGDPRHRDVEQMIRQPIDRPSFSNWSMCYALVRDGAVKAFGGSMSVAAARDLSAYLRRGRNPVQPLIADFLAGLCR